MKTIYLDYASNTPLRPEVFDAMLPYQREHYGNPSSIHHKGREASRVIEEARASIASVLEVTPREILFTSGGTEANNLALSGVAHAYASRGKHILISHIEHHSILHVGEALKEEGFDVEYIPVDTTGRVSVAEVEKRVRPDTILVSVMYANNEIGTIQPIEEIGAYLRTLPADTRPFFHTDACQAVGHIPVSPHELGVDLMTINSGKIYGPTGIGLLFVREGVTLHPLLYGGNQERGIRPGTESLPLIVGFERALVLSLQEREETYKHLSELQGFFLKLVEKRLKTALLTGARDHRLPGNIHLTFPHIEGESILLLLDFQGICVSTGSACASHNLAPSHVLRALALGEERVHGSIRITMGRHTTKTELLIALEALESAVTTLTRISPLPLSL